jgi:hypothetical protein
MGYFVVDNAFWRKKKTLKKLLAKNYLHVSFLLYVFTCCLLHNLFRSQTKSNIQRLMKIIEMGDAQII